jgi:hypothetical protein
MMFEDFGERSKARAPETDENAGQSNKQNGARADEAIRFTEAPD